MAAVAQRLEEASKRTFIDLEDLIRFVIRKKKRLTERLGDRKTERQRDRETERQ